jgi:ATP-dependent DNA ligase
VICTPCDIFFFAFLEIVDASTDRYPLIREAALRHRTTSFVLDGEAVLLGVDGRSDFNGLHSRRHDDEVQLYAFDLLAADGEDLRSLPPHLRKNSLARLLARRSDGIHVAPFEQGERSARSFFAPPVTWGSRAWSPSIASGPTAPAGSRIGSR